MEKSKQEELEDCMKTLLSGFNLLVFDTAAVAVAAKRSKVTEEEFMLVMYQALMTIGNYIKAEDST
jgi:hypothetical protein